MEPEPMNDQIFLPELPGGLTIGDSWDEVLQPAEISFPFDGSIVESQRMVRSTWSWPRGPGPLEDGIDSAK